MVLVESSFTISAGGVYATVLYTFFRLNFIFVNHLLAVLADNVWTPQSLDTPKYVDLVMAGEDCRKGGPLLKYLQSRKIRPKHVLVVDDKYAHLESIARRMPLGLCEFLTVVLYTGEFNRTIEYHANYPTMRERMKQRWDRFVGHAQ